MDTPERVLGDFRGINITGCLMPVWKDTEQPVMTQIPGVDAYFISVFDNEEALHKQTAFVVIGNYVTHSEHDGTPVVNIDYSKGMPVQDQKNHRRSGICGVDLGSSEDSHHVESTDC
jgi:hypothetical protein